MPDARSLKGVSLFSTNPESFHRFNPAAFCGMVAATGRNGPIA
jgi:hypothetical protein